jgi:hypothetical protein
MSSINVQKFQSIELLNERPVILTGSLVQIKLKHRNYFTNDLKHKNIKELTTIEGVNCKGAIEIALLKRRKMRSKNFLQEFFERLFSVI